MAADAGGNKRAGWQLRLSILLSAQHQVNLKRHFFGWTGSRWLQIFAGSRRCPRNGDRVNP